MEHETNKDRLRQTAERLFAARGYDAVGIREVVETAGVTKPTLYYHFGSKQGLLDAIFARHYQQLLAVLGEASSYDGDLLKTMKQLVTAYLTYAGAHADTAYLQLAMTYLPISHGSAALITPYAQQLQQFFVDLFTAAVPEHGNLRGHERILAVSLLGVLNNHVILLLNGQVPLTERGTEALVKQYMYGIYVL